MPSTTAATTANGASVLSQSLERYYADPYCFSILMTITSPSEHKRAMSLRLIEWYVTECVKHVVPDTSVVAQYADNLNVYTRKMFDPFRRGQHCVLRCGDSELLTTTGQMNFFRWFIEAGLWQRVQLNAEELSLRMASHAEHKERRQCHAVATREPEPKPKPVFQRVLKFD
jgi:hypothetical protein